jgi:hypothetical protein
MSPSTALRPRSDEAASWRGIVTSDLVAIVIASIAALVLTSWLVAMPDRVSLTVDNGTDYELTIEATSTDHDGWLPVMVIEPGREQTKDGVIDQGSDWVLRFTGQGHDGGEITVTREQLQTDGWHFTVPSDVADRLEADGATPPPR